MVSVIKRYWRHPLSRQAEIDSPEAISFHRKIIESKPIMRSIYRFWYRQFLASVRATRHLEGPMVEIGCGASHLERYIPEVVKTDCVRHSNIDEVVDATRLPYADNSLRAIFVLNAIHHFDFPARFLAEAQRCLKPGGRLVITEPSNSPIQKFMIKTFHPYEYYDESVTDWVNTPHGRLSMANNALPWILFERDRQRLLEAFPRLSFIDCYRHTFLIYFASGGLSYRSFLPSFTLPFIWVLERVGTTLFPQLGTEMTVVMEKKA